jgi:hypothetical protein
MCINETYSKVYTDKYLSDNSPVQNGLKRRGFITIALEYATRNVYESQVGIKLIRTHQLLNCVDDANLLGDNIDTAERS